MDPINAYKFCPVCSSSLTKKEDMLLVCKNGHKLYINPLACNGVIIENEKQEILLVKRNNEPFKEYWDLPGGFINPDENLNDSVKREIKEELDIEVKVGKVIGVYNDKYLYQNINYPSLAIIVTAKKISGDIRPLDDVSGYKFFSKEEILNQKIAFSMIKQAIFDYINS